MNRDKLILLGCGSLAFMLLTSNAANAGMIAPKDLVDVEFGAPNVEAVNTPVAQKYPQYPIQDALDFNSATIVPH